jgi:DTW domain-containing protein YfiP
MSRPTCARCERPERACLCRWVTPTDHQVEVLILQHPLEVHQAKGSARLLELSLAHCRRVVGEVFEPQALAALLAPAGSCRCSVLLYPEQDAAQGADAAALRWAASDLPRQPRGLRLVVLDGTWRKSRKMLHLNPALQRLPRLALADPPPSHYRVRKAHRADQLSTLEATVLALRQIEGGEPGVGLLAAFDGFVAAQCEWQAGGGNQGKQLA